MTVISAAVRLKLTKRKYLFMNGIFLPDREQISQDGDPNGKVVLYSLSRKRQKNKYRLLFLLRLVLWLFLWFIPSFDPTLVPFRLAIHALKLNLTCASLDGGILTVTMPDHGRININDRFIQSDWSVCFHSERHRVKANSINCDAVKRNNLFGRLAVCSPRIDETLDDAFNWPVRSAEKWKWRRHRRMRRPCWRFHNLPRHPTPSSSFLAKSFGLNWLNRTWSYLRHVSNLARFQFEIGAPNSKPFGFLHWI